MQTPTHACTRTCSRFPIGHSCLVLRLLVAWPSTHVFCFSEPPWAGRDYDPHFTAGQTEAPGSQETAHECKVRTPPQGSGTRRTTLRTLMRQVLDLLSCPFSQPPQCLRVLHGVLFVLMLCLVAFTRYRLKNFSLLLGFPLYLIELSSEMNSLQQVPAPRSAWASPQ